MNCQYREPGEGGPAQSRLPQRERGGAARGSQSCALGLEPPGRHGGEGRGVGTRSLPRKQRGPLGETDVLILCVGYC